MSTLPRFELDKLPRRLIIDPPMSNAEFEAFCLENDEARIELTHEGVILMNPPTGRETSQANSEITAQLYIWWSQHEIGMVADSSGGFRLTDGSMLSPDAAYILPKKRKAAKQKTVLFQGCPDFVIELFSKSDNLAETKEKMERWIANGAQLGWLIDPYRKRVLVYRPQIKTETFKGKILKGEGPVQGFDLDLTRIWRYFKP